MKTLSEMQLIRQKNIDAIDIKKYNEDVRRAFFGKPVDPKAPETIEIDRINKILSNINS
jgi:hypothetical protein